eukprot:GHVR01099002.1.p1 GENE.GHVR01099002.1~~GHVR01099002.1.p1  ORF type:complete len:101 (+),score=18.31 GHVR01099002.1:239-541(+)
MRKALSLVEAHLGQLDVTTDIAKKVEGRLSKTQREYLLRQQMQVSLFLFTYGRLVRRRVLFRLYARSSARRTAEARTGRTTWTNSSGECISITFAYRMGD